MIRRTLTRKSDLAVSNWSGGSTTQLFLYPGGASYAARDFQVRVSSATVDQTPSAFTSLPGYHRVLMPLSAPLKLAFENHGAADLRPFESVEFNGGWNTTSHGICTDIGIMLTAPWRGSLTAVSGGVYECPAGFTGIYALADEVTAAAAGEEYTLMRGDFLMWEVDTAETEKLALATQGENAAILVRIFQIKNSNTPPK